MEAKAKLRDVCCCRQCLCKSVSVGGGRDSMGQCQSLQHCVTPTALRPWEGCSSLGLGTRGGRVETSHCKHVNQKISNVSRISRRIAWNMRTFSLCIPCHLWWVVSSWFKLSSSASGGLWSDESTMQLNSLCDMVLA